MRIRSGETVIVGIVRIAIAVEVGAFSNHSSLFVGIELFSLD
jgi:hypothetical protein